jgi:hypothetical protein
MSGNPLMPGGNEPCDAGQQDLVLLLYDELPATRRRQVESHALVCSRCRQELMSYRTTLEAVDLARLTEMATVESPGDWDALRARLRLSDRGRLREVMVPALKAAAIVLLAGAAFALGRAWDELSLGPIGGYGATGPSSLAVVPQLTPPAEQGTASHLQEFSQETNGYLDRTRLVLLEFANADAASDSGVLREASLVLLAESRRARNVADRIADPRIDEIMVRLEGILRDITRLSEAGDAASMDRIKARMRDSGVLDQLEIMSVASDRIAAAGPRT